MFNEENLPKLSIVCGGKVGAEDQVGAFISSLAYIYTVGGENPEYAQLLDPVNNNPSKRLQYEQIKLKPHSIFSANILDIHRNNIVESKQSNCTQEG